MTRTENRIASSENVSLLPSSNRLNRAATAGRRWPCHATMLGFLLALATGFGCSDTGNRVVDIDPNAVPVQTPEQAQAEADAALPKT